MIPQAKTIDIIKSEFLQRMPHVRFIKIAGSKFQEKGLPDLMILLPLPYPNLWIEVKNDWKKDKPQELQKWNIRDLKKYGIMTGFAVGDEFKIAWSSPNIYKISTVVDSVLMFQFKHFLPPGDN